MRTITHKDLPNTKLKYIGTAPLNAIFPFETKLRPNVHAYIHYDGSLIRFFRIKEIDIKTLQKAIKCLDYSSSMQIYRYHTPDNDCFYLSIRNEIQYGDIIPVSIIKEFSLDPIGVETNAINDRTNNAFIAQERVVNNFIHTDIEYLDSDLAHTLIDFENGNDLVYAIPVKTNLSFIKTGKNRYGTLVSLNNMLIHPLSYNCVRDHTFLQRIVIISPSSKRQQALRNRIHATYQLIEGLKCSDYNPNFNHILSNTEEDRIFYSDITFYLSSDNNCKLSDEFKIFHEKMIQNDIALYCHTNTTRETYLSMIPGNDVYGIRYSLLFENYLIDLVWKTIGL